MWAVPSNAVFCIIRNSMFSDIIFKFSSMFLLTMPSAPHMTGIILTFLRFQHFFNSISNPLYFVFFCTFGNNIERIGYCYIYYLASIIFSIMYYNIWLVTHYFFISYYWKIPHYCDIILNR